MVHNVYVLIMLVVICLRDFMILIHLILVAEYLIKKKYLLKNIFLDGILDVGQVKLFFYQHLEYFYNQTELNRMLTYVNSSTTNQLFTALNISENSSFDLNSTIEILVENLFVETWTKKLNYTSYFNQCKPETCIFDVNERASVLYIITSLLGLYGGLSVVLLFGTPFVVTYIIKRIRRRRTNLLVQQADAAG